MSFHSRIAFITMLSVFNLSMAQVMPRPNPVPIPNPTRIPTPAPIPTPIPTFTRVPTPTPIPTFTRIPVPTPTPTFTRIPIPTPTSVPSKDGVTLTQCQDGAYAETHKNDIINGKKFIDICGEIIAMEQANEASKFTTVKGLTPEAMARNTRGSKVENTFLHQKITKASFDNASKQRFVPNPTGRGGHIVYTPVTQEGHYASGFIGLSQNMGQFLAAQNRNKSVGINRELSLGDKAKLMQRLQWDGNGNKIESCDEYAYERNGEYNLIDEKAAYLQSSREMLSFFNNKLQTNTPFHAKNGTVSHTFAWVQDAMNDYIQESNEGKNYMPNNKFYDVHYSEALAQFNPKMFESWGYPRKTFDHEPPTPTERKWTLRNFDWYINTGVTLSAKNTDDKLNDLDKLQQEFVETLEARRKVIDNYYQEMNSMMSCTAHYKSPPQTQDPDGPIPDYSTDPWWNDLRNTMTEVPGVLENPAAVGNLQILGGITAISKIGNIRGIGKVTIPNVGRIGGLGGLNRPLNLGNNPRSNYVLRYETNHDKSDSTEKISYSYRWDYDPNGINVISKGGDLGTFACSFDNIAKAKTVVANTYTKITALDNEVNRLLNIAYTQGCLAKEGVTNCDWSPNSFTRFIRSGFAKIQQSDYKLCRRTVNKKFEPTRLGEDALITYVNSAKTCENPPTLPGQDPSVAKTLCVINQGWIPNGYTDDTSKFDWYTFLWAAMYKKAQDDYAKAAHFLIKHDGIQALGFRTSKNPSVGGDAFGASISLVSGSETYLDSTGLPAVDPTNGRAVTHFNQANIYASLSSNVNVLWTTFDVAHLNVEMKSNGMTHFEGRSSGQVLGSAEIFANTFGAGDTNFTFFAQASKEEQSPEAVILFPVLGFANIKITGKATVSAGAEGSLQGQANSLSRSDSGLYAAIIGESGSVGPYARSDAFMTASIDLGIADVGVKGRLNLFSANLPVSTGIAWTNTNLQMSSQAELQLGTLSGTVSAYVSLPWPASDIEADLFSWSGVVNKYPLYSDSQTIYANSAYSVLSGTGIDVEGE